MTGSHEVRGSIPLGSTNISRKFFNTPVSKLTDQAPGIAHYAENRIIAAQKPVSGKASWAYYTYNGDGQRVRRKIATYEIWQVYGFDDELLAEYPQTGPSMAVH